VAAIDFNDEQGEKRTFHAESVNQPKERGGEKKKNVPGGPGAVLRKGPAKAGKTEERRRNQSFQKSKERWGIQPSLKSVLHWRNKRDIGTKQGPFRVCPLGSQENKGSTNKTEEGKIIKKIKKRRLTRKDGGRGVTGNCIHFCEMARSVKGRPGRKSWEKKEKELPLEVQGTRKRTKK